MIEKEFEDMTVDTYMCTECFEPKIFKPEDRDQSHICPKCGSKMEYWATEEINPITGKVDNASYDVMSDTSKVTTITSSANKNVPKCPICNSTNLSKISAIKKAGKIGLFGIFGAGDIGKTWKCNSCGSKF